MSFAVALLFGVWAFAAFTIAAAGGLFRRRGRTWVMPKTRHRRTEIAETFDGT